MTTGRAIVSPLSLSRAPASTRGACADRQAGWARSSTALQPYKRSQPELISPRDIEQALAYRLASAPRGGGLQSGLTYCRAVNKNDEQIQLRQLVRTAINTHLVSSDVLLDTQKQHVCRIHSGGTNRYEQLWVLVLLYSTALNKVCHSVN